MRSNIVAFVLFFASISFPQNDKIPVKVTINADETFQSEVESYIKRELRALGDVRIVDDYLLLRRLDRPGLFKSLSISMTEVKNKGGDFIGYAASIMYSTYYDIYDESNEEIKRDIEMDRKSRFSEQYPYHYISIYGKDLKGFCEKIVADFDTEVLEEYRKIIQQIKE